MFFIRFEPTRLALVEQVHVVVAPSTQRIQRRFKTPAEIGKQFTLSEETVKRHLSNIFDKTGVSTRLELALFSIAHHMADPQ
jgi:hypothetical protein